MSPGKFITGMFRQLDQRQQRGDNRIVRNGGFALVNDRQSLALAAKEVHHFAAGLILAHENGDGKPPFDRRHLPDERCHYLETLPVAGLDRSAIGVRFQQCRISTHVPEALRAGVLAP